MRRLIRYKACFFLAVFGLSLLFAPVADAQPAWQDINGVWWSNVCRAPSGAWWVYPMREARPVGAPCRIYSTGEPGVVTMN